MSGPLDKIKLSKCITTFISVYVVNSRSVRILDMILPYGKAIFSLWAQVSCEAKSNCAHGCSFLSFGIFLAFCAGGIVCNVIGAFVCARVGWNVAFSLPVLTTSLICIKIMTIRSAHPRRSAWHVETEIRLVGIRAWHWHVHWNISLFGWCSQPCVWHAQLEPCNFRLWLLITSFKK